MQELFEWKFPFLKLESKYTELWLKKTWIKVFPTKNIKDIRGYFEASYIWVDESDHMEPSIQEELFYAIDHMKRNQIVRLFCQALQTDLMD